MAGMRDEYGNLRRTDEYGNPIAHGAAHGGYNAAAGGALGAYGATAGHGTAAPGVYGTTGAATGYGAASGGHMQQMPPAENERHGISGMLHRSGSSSSSEDDGMGGRRKKDKSRNRPTGQFGEQQEHKGIMDKIKEKLPGHHN